MTLPYDIARCAGERDFHGAMCPQCRGCARQVYSGPRHSNPHMQPWMEPHHGAHGECCPYYIPAQTNKGTNHENA